MLPIRIFTGADRSAIAVNRYGRRARRAYRLSRLVDNLDENDFVSINPTTAADRYNPGGREDAGQSCAISNCREPAELRTGSWCGRRDSDPHPLAESRF